MLDSADDWLVMTLTGGAAARAAPNVNTGAVEVSVIDDDPHGSAAADLYRVLVAVLDHPMSLHVTGERDHVLAQRR